MLHDFARLQVWESWAVVGRIFLFLPLPITQRNIIYFILFILFFLVLVFFGLVLFFVLFFCHCLFFVLHSRILDSHQQTSFFKDSFTSIRRKNYPTDKNGLWVKSMSYVSCNLYPFGAHLLVPIKHLQGSSHTSFLAAATNHPASVVS